MRSFGKGKLNENGIELLELCVRRNPVRNQIDYIIMRRSDMNKVSDSRSYSANSHSDHRLVLATVREILPPPRRKINAIRIDIDKLKNPHLGTL